MRYANPILPALLALALAGCSLSGGDPLDEARDHLAAQDYIAARDGAQAVLSGDGANKAALEVLARSQIAIGQGADALATLERLGNGEGEPDDFTLLMAEAQLQAGNAAAARASIGDADSAEAWRLRALIATAEGDDEAALAAFTEGRHAGGARGKLFAAEATYRLDRGDLPAARDAVALAQDVAPDGVETLFVSARLAGARGEHGLALSDYLRIIEIAPLDRPALVAAIAASERAGVPDITRHLIAYGAQTRPLDSEFVYQQARVEAWDGEWDAVRMRLQAHEAELADHDPARLLYAEALLRLGQVETARAIAAPIVARNGQDPEVMRVQAAIAAAS